MGFSGNVLVKMADGTQKQIQDIKADDNILDMNMRPSRVIKKNIETKQVVKIQIENFAECKVTPTQEFFCFWKDGTQSKYGYRTLNASNYNQLSLKSTSNIFTNANLKTIVAFDDSDINLTDQVYSLKTNSNTQTYFVNNIIVKNV